MRRQSSRGAHRGAGADELKEELAPPELTEELTPPELTEELAEGLSTEPTEECVEEHAKECVEELAQPKRAKGLTDRPAPPECAAGSPRSPLRSSKPSLPKDM